ncbi:MULTISPECIES: hypothetical protein [unclassified Moorena]|nr:MULTISPECIES: hypothetical protein [unclassified Moorena]
MATLREQRSALAFGHATRTAVSRQRSAVSGQPSAVSLPNRD